MQTSAWQRRIERAEELGRQHGFAAEILGFYIQVARFQEGLHGELGRVLQSAAVRDRELGSGGPGSGELGFGELDALVSRFDAFLKLAEMKGPEQLGKLSRELRGRGHSGWAELLREAWASRSVSGAQGLLALAFLQPYAELLRARASGAGRLASDRGKRGYALCPFCGRRPGVGVLRPLGEGGARSLVCFFCLAEWEFRRIVCPGCGEEDYRRLAVFSAEQFDCIRVESCETCKTYIKTVDLTKNGRAEPVVDELASAPLDLWAREQGLEKVQCNVLGM